MPLAATLRRLRASPALGLLIAPNAVWRDVASGELPSIAALFRHAIALAVLGPAFLALGLVLVGIEGGLASQASPMLANSAMGQSITAYVFPSSIPLMLPDRAFSAAEAATAAGTCLLISLGTPLVFALLLYALAPLCPAERSFPKSLVIAVYSATPVWIAGPALALPSLYLIPVIALMHGLFIAQGGVRTLLGARDEDAAVLIGLTIFTALALAPFAGYLAAAF